MEKIIFLCTNNSARSQMAEGILKVLAGNKYEVYSAGTNPTRVNPYAVIVMKEIGIDISKNRSKRLDEYKDIEFNLAVTLCDGAAKTCPYISNTKKIIHRGFDDPVSENGTDEEKLNKFRIVRDQIKKWIKQELIEND